MINLRMRRVHEITNPAPPLGGESDENIRNVAACAISHDGKRLLVGTYGGIFEYNLGEPFDMATLKDDARMITQTNRDGSAFASDGEWWKGQEGVAYDYTGDPTSDPQYGRAVFSVSEHHKKLYYLACDA